MICRVLFVLCLTMGAAFADNQEDLSTCLFWKGTFLKYDEKGYDFTPSNKLEAPSEKIHYWTIRFQDKDLVIPVDEYKSVFFMADDKKERFDSLGLISETREVKISLLLSGIASSYEFLGQAIHTGTDKIDCYRENLKSTLETLKGIGFRSALFLHKPTYVSPLDASQEGWLVMSGDNKEDEARWTTVSPAGNSGVVSYELKYALGKSNSKQMGRVLSQHRDDLLAGAEPIPNWLLEIEERLGRAFGEDNSIVLQAMREAGFREVDVGGLSAVAFEKIGAAE